MCIKQNCALLGVNKRHCQMRQTNTGLLIQLLSTRPLTPLLSSPTYRHARCTMHLNPYIALSRAEVVHSCNQL